jgi:transposase InsO family protein
MTGPVYALNLFNVTDRDEYLAYSRKSATEVQAHGGRVVALGKFREATAGDIKPRAVMILVEWASKAAFDDYCNDPKLADLHPQREKGARDYVWHLLVVVRLDRRALVWINVTQNSTAEWVARQLTEAFPWDEAPGYLIGDNDQIYGELTRRRIRAMGIRDKPTAPGSPWQNGFAERLIGSIRRECLDHLVVLDEAQLRRILRSYANYYNKIRTHRSLGKDAPCSRPVHVSGRVTSNPRRASSPLCADLSFWYRQEMERKSQNSFAYPHLTALPCLR